MVYTGLITALAPPHALVVLNTLSEDADLDKDATRGRGAVPRRVGGTGGGVPPVRGGIGSVVSRRALALALTLALVLSIETNDCVERPRGRLALMSESVVERCDRVSSRVSVYTGLIAPEPHALMVLAFVCVVSTGLSEPGSCDGRFDGRRGIVLGCCVFFFEGGGIGGRPLRLIVDGRLLIDDDDGAGRSGGGGEEGVGGNVREIVRVLLLLLSVGISNGDFFSGFFNVLEENSVEDLAL